MMLILGQVRLSKGQESRAPRRGYTKYFTLWVQFCVGAIPMEPVLGQVIDFSRGLLIQANILLICSEQVKQYSRIFKVQPDLSFGKINPFHGHVKNLVFKIVWFENSHVSYKLFCIFSIGQSGERYLLKEQNYNCTNYKSF